MKAGGEGDRGWDGWMASLTQPTWIWASSRRWWSTGKPGVLQSWGCRVRHDWKIEQQQPNSCSTILFPMFLVLKLQKPAMPFHRTHNLLILFLLKSSFFLEKNFIKGSGTSQDKGATLEKKRIQMSSLSPSPSSIHSVSMRHRYMAVSLIILFMRTLVLLHLTLHTVCWTQDRQGKVGRQPRAKRLEEDTRRRRNCRHV